ncbi:hypothetical protein BJV77DRAFT_984703 [Russula vinacea]|nr:hypothetical protein BJV77DRAFT_984703 [Russula vinacea]
MERISTICFLVIASSSPAPLSSHSFPCSQPDHATMRLDSSCLIPLTSDQRTNRSPLDLVKTFQVGFILETVVGL